MESYLFTRISFSKPVLRQRDESCAFATSNDKRKKQVMSDLKKTRMGFKDNQNHSLLLLLLLVLRFFLFFFLFAFFFASPEFQAFQPVAMTLFGTECIAVLFGERGSFRMQIGRAHV